MNIFAIELSSAKGSIAHIQNGETLSKKEWTEDFRNREQLFTAIRELQINWDTIDCFAIGRGPGAFSGMRISFSIINAFAAPNKTPVYALNSGASIAKELALPQLAVIGDARQKKVWMGVFKGTQLQDPFQLVPAEELSNVLPKATPIVSPDYNRLQPVLGKINWLTEKNDFPDAIALGQLVEQRINKKVKSEPLEPLYMHPPVFTKPRFV